MTEESRKRGFSLRAKLLVMMLVGLILSLGIYFLIQSVGKGIIRNTYLKESSVRHREMGIISEFQEFIAGSNLSSKDTEAITRWTMARGDIYLLTYQNQYLVLEAGERAALNGEKFATGNNYPVTFRDGVFQVVVYDFSETHIYDLLTVFSVGLACLGFAVLMLMYNGRVTRAVAVVSREIREIDRGNLELPLQYPGSDELAQLAGSVDSMRRSLLRKTAEEQEAREKNRDLITAMSHDIRNPLTALMGYLDLAREGQYRTEEELQQYLESGYARAEQLRTLTDELFRYALVFGNRELPMTLEDYDAPILLEQLLGEPCVMLMQYGIEVQAEPLTENCRIRVDVSYLKRVFDNLFDNIRKYADYTRPVLVRAQRSNGWLKIQMSNDTADHPGQVESNKIGLRTCERIMVQMGGSFRKREEGGRFTAELTLPILKEDSLAN